MHKEIITIKPHHFVDILTSFGDEKRAFQPHPYRHSLHTISQRILDNHDILLEIELGADDICKPCTHNVSGSCDDTIDTSFRPTAPSSKGKWNLLIDRRWCERIKVKQGDKLNACELAERIRGYMGDITDIYREIPADRTAERTRKLLGGIRFFVG
jgi:hypothetical protein